MSSRELASILFISLVGIALIIWVQWSHTQTILGALAAPVIPAPQSGPTYPNAVANTTNGAIPDFLSAQAQPYASPQKEAGLWAGDIFGSIQ